MDRIDFVIAWVDGADPAWLEEKRRTTSSGGGDGQEVRFRDWGTLKYLFRSIEKFAPWVSRVHFVTWGHLPPWMNEQCEKLHIVNHRDFIPAEYLPTFNSRTISLNLHRIPEISEQFVYFNDDMYLTRPLKPEAFFKNGLPVDYAVLYPYAMKRRELFAATVANNITLINANFKKREMLRKNFGKYFNYKYKKSLRYTLAGLVYPNIIGFWRSHFPQPFLKATYQTVWEKEEPSLRNTCLRKLRTPGDVNEWLMRYWQLAEGHFTPTGINGRKYFTLGEKTANTLDAIKNQRFSMLCINDNRAIEGAEEMEKIRDQIVAAFETILPEKCSFEK